MANIDLRDPTAADVGVPGAFQQANTTYTFEIDMASYAGVRELDDIVELINLPQGFVAMGGAIETVEVGTNSYDVGIFVGGDPLIAAVSQPANGERVYNDNGVTIVASLADSAGRVLTFITGSLDQIPTDGKFIVTVTGIALHGRG